MADITSVLEIDIKDDAFKQLKADIEAFRQSMGAMGGVGPGKAMVPYKAREMAKDYADQDKAMKKATDSIFKFGTQMTRLTTNIAVDSGKKLVGAFSSMTKAILGTGGLLAGITSVASVAGVMGAAAQTQRRLYQATGLGFTGATDIPRLKTTLGSVMDVEGIAGHLQSEMNQPGSLLISGMSQMMGISPSQMKNMSKDALMFQFAKYAAKQGKAPGGMMPAQMGASGLSFLGTEGLTRIVANESRLGQLERENAELAKNTTLKGQSTWQRFGQAAQASFLTGETKMMNLVEPLLDPLMAIGKTLADKFEGDMGLGGIVDKIRVKMIKFNDAFANVHNWKDFGHLLVETFKDAMKELKPIFDELKEFMKSVLREAFAPMIEAANTFKQVLVQISNGPLSSLLGLTPIGAGDMTGRINPNMDISGLSASEGAAMRKGGAYAGLFEKYGGMAGVDPAILFGMGMTESRFNPLAHNASGATGLMQFMPSTASRFGIDPKDPEQSIRGASEYFRKLKTMFKGDDQAAIAAYNWGEGNVQRAQKKYGADWFSHAPKETREYVPQVMRYAQMAGRNLQVSVSAPAGSDVTVNETRAVGAASGP
jgi:hypothetical protein